MRHGNSGRRLGRNSSHRSAMFNNMVTSLVLHGRIETTEAKAKELRRFADDCIAWGVEGHKLASDNTPANRAKVVHAKRMARQTIMTDVALAKLFTEVGPRMAGRNGGFTRLVKTRIRKGDAAHMAIVELA